MIRQKPGEIYKALYNAGIRPIKAAKILKVSPSTIGRLNSGEAQLTLEWRRCIENLIKLVRSSTYGKKAAK